MQSKQGQEESDFVFTGGPGKNTSHPPAVAGDRDGTHQTQPRQSQPIRTTQNMITQFLHVT